jgi:SAM-dependent methyltransferase
VGGTARSFDALVAEAEHAPIDGWDFSWLDGRATEERPSWGYSYRVAERAARAERMLDLQSGGGEMLSALPKLPPLLVATEGYAPNVVVAARRLQPRGAHVIATEPDRPALPIASNAFDLVTSRHPVDTWWGEIARVLRPAGTYFSQQVGESTMRELSEALMGPLPPGSPRDPELAREAAARSGLVVEDLQLERLRAAFFDVGAVVYFLRLVVWTVPDFTVDRYRPQLRALHDTIERDGSFVAHSTRFLIEATKPR